MFWLHARINVYGYTKGTFFFLLMFSFHFLCLFYYYLTFLSIQLLE